MIHIHNQRKHVSNYEHWWIWYINIRRPTYKLVTNCKVPTTIQDVKGRNVRIVRVIILKSLNYKRAIFTIQKTNWKFCLCYIYWVCINVLICSLVWEMIEIWQFFWGWPQFSHLFFWTSLNTFEYIEHNKHIMFLPSTTVLVLRAAVDWLMFSLQCVF